MLHIELRIVHDDDSILVVSRELSGEEASCLRSLRVVDPLEREILSIDVPSSSPDRSSSGRIPLHPEFEVGC